MTATVCSMPSCPTPDRPVHDQAWVCAGCGRAFGLQLADAPGLLAEVETTRARLARIGDPGAGSGDRPPPWHEKASAVGAELTNAVSTLARHVSETRGHPVPARVPPLCGPPCPAGWCRHDTCRALRADQPAGPVAAAAVWLLGHVEWLRHRPEGPELMAELGGIVGRARQVIDRQADRWYAGPCGEPTDAIVGGCPCACHSADVSCDLVGGCGVEWHRPVRCPGELYARPGAPYVACRACGAEYDVTVRRDWLLAAAAETLAHAELIGRAVPTLGVPITPAVIRGYAFRGRITAHGVDMQGRPLYRVGDVIEVAQQIAAEKERHQSRRTVDQSA